MDRRPRSLLFHAVCTVCALGVSLGSSTVAAQTGFRTLVRRGGVTDTLELGRVSDLRLGREGDVWMLTHDSTGAEAAWHLDALGRLRREDARDFPRAPLVPQPDPRAWGDPEPLPPDTLALERAMSPVSPSRIWVELDPDRFVWIDPPTGRVFFYRSEGMRAVRTGAVTVPQGRRPGALDATLGLERAAEEDAPRNRVARALADDVGRLWLLLGGSSDREEWAVMDPHNAGLVEMLVLPARFFLWAVHGDRLVGVQRGEERDALHVLGRDAS